MPTRPLVTRYEDDLKLWPDRWHKVGVLFFVVLACGFPFVADEYWMGIGNTALISIVGAVALMILTGFAGQISLGHAAFLAWGAYTVAILGKNYGVPFWLALPAGGLVSTVVGLIIGPFALRLEGLYLAIVTIGLLFLTTHTILSFEELTGATAGTSVPMYTSFPDEIEPYALGDFADPTTLPVVGELVFEQKLYFLYLFIAFVVALAAKNLQRSNTGRAMMAVRDHDMAAAVLGVNPAKAKITAFAISSFFAGVAGGMFAYQQTFISTDAVTQAPFNLIMSVNYIAMIVLGGIGTVFGAVAGALFFAIMTPLAELLGKELEFLSGLSSDQQATLLFALVVLGFLVFEPFGLVGIWMRIKRYFMAWPFKY